MKNAFIYNIAILLILSLLFGCSNGQDVSSITNIESTNSIKQDTLSQISSTENIEQNDNNNENEIINITNPITDEFNAVWFSYFELSDMVKGKTEEQFRQNIKTAYKNVADLGLDAVIMHVRPSSDAFYESDIFPWSIYCSGTQGVSPGFDP